MTLTLGLPMLAFLIATALVFDLLNGMHDAANSIATIVATRVLSPRIAVLWAAFFNFIAFLFFGLHVANTIGTGLLQSGVADPIVIFGALGGAIGWNILTWRLGIPSSSSHALVGGLIGAGICKAGVSAVLWQGLVPIALAIVLSPMVGLIGAMILMLGIAWMCVRSTSRVVDARFRRLQLVSSALISLAHGGNDAQKTMGIIAILLYSQGQLGPTFHVPLWVVLACEAAMAIGTYLGGWKIVQTMGARITHLTPVQGFCAETGGALALFGATWLGIPVSTTHTVTGSIIGVGAARTPAAVRWGVARGIAVAWVITLPASAAAGAVFYLIGRTILG